MRAYSSATFSIVSEEMWLWLWARIMAGPAGRMRQYEAGVRLVADYARRVMEQAAALRGERLIDVKFQVSDEGPDEK
jgi:hypothetical protein